MSHETSHIEDGRFRSNCTRAIFDFDVAMKYFRLPNKKSFRGAMLRIHVPLNMRDRVTNQCLLEGLI